MFPFSNMNQEKYNLSWHTYTDHLREMLHHMMTSNELTDVILVSEDRKIFKAHKVVLSAFSPVFKSIINDGALSNPTVFLRGIHSNEIQSILQFMYLGEATFYQERMNEFLNVATSLEIKEISKGMDNEQKENQNINQTSDIHKSEEADDSENTVNGQSQIRSNTNSINKYDTVSVCDQCNKQYSDYSGLLRHKKAFHMGTKYPCKQCTYKASYQSDLSRHIKSVHRDSSLLK